MDINLVVVSGRLTADPEIKYSQTGLAIGSFSVAINGMKPKNSDKAPVSFIQVTVFGQPAEWLQNAFHKGSKIVVKGRLDQQRWQDRDTGVNRSTVKIIADQIDWPPKPQGQEAAGEEPQAHPEDEPQADPEFGKPMSELSDDEIPF